MLKTTANHTRRAVDTEHGDDIAGRRLVNVLHRARMHAHQPRHLDALAIRHVDDRGALGQRALVDAHVRELPKARLIELERETDERRVRPRLRRMKGQQNQAGDRIKMGVMTRILNRKTLKEQ